MIKENKKTTSLITCFSIWAIAAASLVLLAQPIKAQEQSTRIFPQNFADIFWNQQKPNYEPKFCWRHVLAKSGTSYKVLTVEQGDADIPSDRDLLPDKNLVIFPIKLKVKDDFEQRGLELNRVYFNQREFTRPNDGKTFQIVTIDNIYFQDKLYFFHHVKISPIDLVGILDFGSGITKQTKFNWRWVNIKGTSYRAVTLED